MQALFFGGWNPPIVGPPLAVAGLSNVSPDLSTAIAVSAHPPFHPAQSKAGGSSTPAGTGNSLTRREKKLLNRNEKGKKARKHAPAPSKGVTIAQSAGQSGSDPARDPVQPPSAASGGVPDPSSTYLLRASFMPQRSARLRPILVVIDLNGTLLYRPSRKRPTQFTERPHARRFLAYCVETFHVVIWSSAKSHNVRNMCDQLLTPAQQERIIAIWGRDRFNLSPEDYNRRTQCYKRLTKLWEHPAIGSTHPEGAPWNQGNTVLIDDSAEKARSEPYNAVTLPEFTGNVHEQPEVLPLVHDYLNLLAGQEDVSMYMRVHPFRVDAYTAALVGDDESPDRH